MVSGRSLQFTQAHCALLCITNVHCAGVLRGQQAERGPAPAGQADAGAPAEGRLLSHLLNGQKLFYVHKISKSKLCQVCPAQMEMDGLLNLWIIKPGCSSRGRGITISNRLERILGIVEHGAGAKQAR